VQFADESEPAKLEVMMASVMAPEDEA